MTKPRDARAQRSADALQVALLTLLKEKPLEQITIREIAALAGINYATFFRHHPSKEALLDHLASDEMRRLVELTLPVNDAVNMEAAVLALVTYVQENRALWTALLTGGAAGLMREELLQLSRLSAAARAPQESWLPLELSISCSVSLIFETLVWWLDQPPEKYSIQQVAEILARLMSSKGLGAFSS